MCILALALPFLQTVRRDATLQMLAVTSGPVLTRPTAATSDPMVAARLTSEQQPSGPGGTGAPALAPVQSTLVSGAATSFARFTLTLPGRVEVALAPLGAAPAQTLGGDVAERGWSTTKVAVLSALLKARGPSGLTERERRLAHAAITESNNEAILGLFGDLERIEGGLDAASSSVQQLFRQSGDPQTVVATAPPPPGAVTTFGQTEWKPSEAVKFFRALADGCLLPEAQTRYVLNLMEHIVPSESWGLGSAGFRSVAFKGGWGPEPSGSYLVRQSGIVEVGTDRAVAVAIVALPPGTGEASFEVGAQMVTKTAQWLHRELQGLARPAARC